ncbi:MAG: trypsin-like peptidase domain-containing protein [Chloroflexota bacterium]
MRKFFSVRFVLLVGVITLSILACELTDVFPGSNPPSLSPTLTTTSPVAAPPPIAPDLVGLQDQLVQLYKEVNPGVVAIRVLGAQEGLGSGFVFDRAGHIVTNYHVIQDATYLEVDFPSGYKTRAEVIGTDPDSDLAVIKLETLPPEIYPLILGESDQVQVGQMVVAIGNPFGLDGSMTIGIVSAMGRTMESEHESPGGQYFTAGDLIQTDAAINPGNSGGPLLNLNGEVIGVNRAIRTTNFNVEGQPTSAGIGFAIPVNLVKQVVPSLISEGKYDYPYLGISSMDSLGLYEQELLGLPRSTGVYVAEATPGGPAALAGVRGGTLSTDRPGLLAGGDLIIAIDGEEARDFSDLLSYLLYHTSPGDRVTLTILRGNGRLEIPVTLEKRP